MTNIERQQIIRELVRASDAIHHAFQMAACTNQLDLAKALRDEGKRVADCIAMVSAPPKMSMAEALGLS